MDQSVAIGGFMGVGKSTVGRLVAGRLGVGFVDLDAQVCATAGMTVAEVFAAEGEQGFRRREAEAVRALVTSPATVLALGGGTLHYGDNLARLREQFFVVSLVAPWPVLQERLGHADPDRPLWSDAERLYAARQAGYTEADAVVDVSDKSPVEACDAVMAVLPW